MYEELVTALRKRAHDLPEKFSKNAENIDLLLKSANAIEELSRDLDSMNDANIALYGALPKWISVTERLPKERINPNTRDFEYVLCVTIWGDVRPFKYGTPIGQKEAHFWNGTGYVDAYVTHWKPLPEPPKESE